MEIEYANPTPDHYINADMSNETAITNLDKAVRALPNNIRWHINIKPYKKRRSNKQNSFYWAVVVPTICKWRGEALGVVIRPEVMHEYTLKPLYCPTTTAINFNGEEVRHYITTTELKTWQFNDMIDQIVAEFAEMGCDIPPPDPNWRKNERRPKEEKL